MNRTADLPINSDIAREMTKGQPRVSIIILTWNSYDVTRDCLASLEKIDYPNREVVVVDNGSGDGSPDRLAKDFPLVRFIRNERNLGFTGGNNVGIRDALGRRPDYLLLLNNDTLVARDFLGKMVELAETDPTIGILTPKIYFADPADRIWFAGGRYRKGRSFPECFGMGKRDDGSYDQVQEVSFVSGCAFLIKAQVVEKIGLLDDSLFLGFEDVDWSIRAVKAGFKGMYVANAFIWHKEGYDTKRNLGKAGKDFYYVRNSIVMARKHLSRVYWPLFALSLSKYLAYRSLGYLIRGEPGRVKALLRGIPAGYQVRIDTT
jgi:GT2 family glycosyltransferase